MKNNDPRELIRSFTDIGGSYENIGLEITVNLGMRFTCEYEFLVHTYHTHPYFELFYVKEEGLRLAARDFATLDLHPGDICIVPPFCDHYTYFDPVPKALLHDCVFVACFSFYDNHLNATRNFYKMLASRISRQAPTLIRKEEYDSRVVESLLTSFERSVFDGEKRAAFLDFCKLLELLTASAGEEKRPLSKSEIIAKIDNFVSCCYMYDMKLTDIAECFFISEHSLNRLINEYYHDTFHSLLTKRRMTVAATFLTNTEHSVAEIAELAGYASLSNFYTAFKKYYGMLPADYRRETKEKGNDTL